MKPIANLAMIAAFSLAAASVSAKTVTSSQKEDERVVNTVAGPGPTPNKQKAADVSQPAKKDLKKSKVKQKPPLTDPN